MKDGIRRELGKAPLKVFQWFCRPEYHRDIEGDLIELYQDRLDEKGPGYANLMSWIDVALLFRPSIIKPISLFNPLKGPFMLKNNLKIAWRQLSKNRFVTLINLSGLIIGMTAALFIWQYVHFESSYDKFHEKSEQIFRIRTDRINDGVPFMQFAGGTAGAAPLLKKHFTQVDDYVKLRGAGEAVFSYEYGRSVRLDRVFFSMPSLFDIFSFSLVEGDEETALSEPFFACISQSTAKKLFGDEDPIGKTIMHNNSRKLQVTGVFADVPANSHIKFDILISYITFTDVIAPDAPTETSMTWDGYYSYVLLQPGTDWQDLESRIPAAIEQDYDPEIASMVALYLQPLEDIHLNSHYLFETEVNGNQRVVQFLWLIGISVLLIAWFNYINFSTANSEVRAREVGVRKVLGGTQRKLIYQFLTEATLLNIFAIAVSFLLVWLLQPFFERLIGQPVSLSIFSETNLLMITVAVLLVGTLLSGLYPAFFLSSMRPIKVLKAGAGGSQRPQSKWLSKGLVTLQFIATVILIAGTFIVNRQLKFLQDTDLGFEVDQTLIVKGPKSTDSTFVSKSNIFKQQLEQLGSVRGVAASTSIPGQAFGWTAGGVQRVGAAEDQSQSFHVMAADVEYADLYDMELVAGRHMSTEMGSDESIACLLNETGAALLDFSSPEDAVGKEIEFWGDRFMVVGVLKDFYQESAKSDIEPLVLRARPPQWDADYYSVKMSTDQLGSTLASVEESWQKVFPEDPFEHFFLNDHFNTQYESELRFSRIFSLFSGLAIFVSCLGLFALVTFTTERRKKEIGIRRVLGAKISGIVRMISMDFVRMILLALILATPLCWYAMNLWLEGFANRVNIPWWYFAIAGSITLIVALLPVSLQSIRAALLNPADTLKNE